MTASKVHKINKILIANRGEIAVRIIRTARMLGIKTVAVFSDADRDSYHTGLADEAYPLGLSDPSASYLNIQKILRIARSCKADAIHPGYGFLSENHLFAEAVLEAGLIFIGPKPDTIKIMGDKLKAKELARQAGVPVIPGFDEAASSVQDAINKAAEIGYPVLIKASAGGGGKGMRIVRQEKDLPENYNLAKNEAKNAFANDSVFIEKFIKKPRHIEVQVLSDSHGNHLHLLERDCSIQRRHQKLIEESPSPSVDTDLRKKLTESAISLTRKCNYLNAGTVEFIVDQNNDFYFLEMNTRLQVEHPVTEFITGIDLVKEQIRIAEGEKIELNQREIKQNGHAIELRVYAEDPFNDFLPVSGKLELYRPPKGPGIRLDDGYYEKSTIPLNYDSMIAKLIVWEETRELAIARLKMAVEEYLIGPMPTTLDFGKWLCEQKDFVDGQYDTEFIHKNMIAPGADHREAEVAKKIAAALSVLLSDKNSHHPKKTSATANKLNQWKKRRF